MDCSVCGKDIPIGEPRVVHTRYENLEEFLAQADAPKIATCASCAELKGEMKIWKPPVEVIPDVPAKEDDAPADPPDESSVLLGAVEPVEGVRPED